MKKRTIISWHIGIDEVGRGSFAGPVCVGVFAIQSKYMRLLKDNNIRDSKQLSPTARSRVCDYLEYLCHEGYAFFVVTEQSASVIDNKGLSWCLQQCISEALDEIALYVQPKNSFIFLDAGLRAPSLWKQQSFVHGDDRYRVISAASIVAKVARDKYMHDIALCYPEYDWSHNVGYGTAKHRKAIIERGLTQYHRRSFCRFCSSD